MEKIEQQSEEEYTVICAYCGRLLHGQEKWEKSSRGESESYACSRSHGICPDCLLENFPMEYLAIQEEKRIRIKNIFKKGYKEFYGYLVK